MGKSLIPLTRMIKSNVLGPEFIRSRGLWPEANLYPCLLRDSLYTYLPPCFLALQFYLLQTLLSSSPPENNVIEDFLRAPQNTLIHHVLHAEHKIVLFTLMLFFITISTIHLHIFLDFRVLSDTGRLSDRNWRRKWREKGGGGDGEGGTGREGGKKE